MSSATWIFIFSASVYSKILPFCESKHATFDLMKDCTSGDEVCIQIIPFVFSDSEVLVGRFVPFPSVTLNRLAPP
ncbi:uncharacterized protein BJ212DRAFT_1382956 [Suillus subaureus]|uniref:Secreted protein n=1 Tax=Suillus subaureus TaxID=48587 RepID=A0A9P7E1V0_9AGAM|nr:uncharacterized protein BJ212DRAFT_1382956 [Suillus subaureus]KAG1808743.1 hypothetical protein BJ212DRAFT_1382956 [Suillus subaureus]